MITMSNMNNRCHLYLPLLPEKSPVRGRKDGPANGSFTFRKRGRTSINGKGRPGWIVQKFGGTSLGKFASEIVDEIIRCIYYLYYLRRLTLLTVFQANF